MQKTMKKAGKGLSIEFNLDESKFKESIVDIPAEADYKTYNSIIGSQSIDIVEFNEQYDIVVDDEGLLVSRNPIIRVHTPYGTVDLAGKLLFLRRVDTDEGISSSGMNPGEVLELLFKLDSNIELIGVCNL
ncbi:hypothetical protein H0266_18400 [Halobacillus locisalis]|uniref:DUF3846 domain-containing protein n=1 Tax=Halobacillus locisalis TaxID=220753 RepID=A0A838CY54_9BACI|nr:hypothetical protein [Halobacillus locisalis]MBA2176854.1 hypothetical protein [Halobacillus locisalis]